MADQPAILNISGNAEFLKEATALALKATQVHAELEIPFAIAPGACTIYNLKDYKYPYGLPDQKPQHIKAKVDLDSADSFCDYVSRYSDHRTAVFADPKKQSFHAVLDYHGPRRIPAAPGTIACRVELPGLISDGAGEGAVAVAASETPTAEEPRIASPEFADHHARFTLATSDQWGIWMEKNEKAIPQSDFAEFLEDNYRDILHPSHAEMLQIARELSAKTDVNFQSKIVPSNGQVQLTYNEVITAGVGPAGTMSIPERFNILIPIFYGENPVKIEARLRFRIGQGKLFFIFKLYRPKELLSDSFNLAAERIGSKIGTQVLLGSLG